jgi:hypothetical protein
MTPRFARARTLALAAALGLTLQAVPALAQQNIGSLFFLNSAYDSVAAGYVDHQGMFQGTYQSGNWAGYTPSSGSTKVINTANGFLVYEPMSGAARVVRISHDGKPVKTWRQYWMSPNWDQIVGSGTFLFFYRADGAAAIGQITPEGYFVQTQGWGPGTFGTWSHVVATDSNLVFYNKANGVMVVGYISFDGYWGYQSYAPYIMWYADTVTSLGRYVICYNSVNGVMEVIDIDRIGQANPTYAEQVGADYSQVVRHGADVVFYSRNSGSAKFGYIDSNGAFVTTHLTSVMMDLYHFGATADSVTSTGEALLFYNRQYGAAIVGAVDRAGEFHQTDATSLSPWFGSIVATAAR